MLMQGIETLPCACSATARTPSPSPEHLEQHPRVAWVNYPGLPDSPYHAAGPRYLPKGAGGILSFGVKSADHKGSRMRRTAPAGRRTFHRRLPRS
jgi:O-acetylhomoserine (thiol)-lyase